MSNGNLLIGLLAMVVGGVLVYTAFDSKNPTHDPRITLERSLGFSTGTKQQAISSPATSTRFRGPAG